MLMRPIIVILALSPLAITGCDVRTPVAPTPNSVESKMEGIWKGTAESDNAKTDLTLNLSFGTRSGEATPALGGTVTIDQHVNAAQKVVGDVLESLVEGLSVDSGGPQTSALPSFTVSGNEAVAKSVSVVNSNWTSTWTIRLDQNDPNVMYCTFKATVSDAIGWHDVRLHRTTK